LDRWNVFVHGFNNSYNSAAATWSRTLPRLANRGVDLSAVVLFYWPGDYTKWEVTSALNYHNTVPLAEQSAELLSEYLRAVTQARRVPLELCFVAHSLGALVVLRTCNLLRFARANVNVRNVLLMAAAVPEGFCEEGQDYGSAFSASTDESVLYSVHDEVLRKYFKLGQELAARLPKHQREAVGRTGGPGIGIGERWSTGKSMDRYDHGDYWNKVSSLDRIARVMSPGLKDFSRRDDSQEVPELLCADALPTDKLAEPEYLRKGSFSSWHALPN